MGQVFQNLAGTTSNQFSVGVGTNRIDLRTNSGVIEYRNYGEAWKGFPDFSSPDPIGDVAPNTGAFTTLSATATNIPVSIDSTNSTIEKILLKNNGTPVGYLGASSTFANSISKPTTTDIPIPASAVLLLHFDSSLTDATGNHTPVSSNTSYDTTTGKFDDAIQMVSNAGRVEIADSTDWTFTGELTIATWFRLDGAPGTNDALIYSDYWGSSYGIVNNGNNINFRFNGSIYVNASYTFTPGTWYHIAITRDSSDDVRCFVNGTQVGSATTISGTIDFQTTGSYAFNINHGLSPTANANCSFDEYLVCNGEALWTSNFTPPSVAYSDNPSYTPSIIGGWTVNGNLLVGLTAEASPYAKVAIKADSNDGSTDAISAVDSDDSVVFTVNSDGLIESPNRIAVGGYNAGGSPAIFTNQTESSCTLQTDGAGNQYGQLIYVKPDYSGGVTSTSTGLFSQVVASENVTTGETVQTIVAGEFDFGTLAGATGTVTNAYGVRTQPYALGTALTTYAHIYMKTVSGSNFTNSWGLYQEGSEPHYLIGNLSIGITDPQNYALRVKSTASYGPLALYDTSGIQRVAVYNAGQMHFQLASATGDNALSSAVYGEAQNRFTMRCDGKMVWGPGGASAQDTTLERDAATSLLTNCDLRLENSNGLTTFEVTASSTPLLRLYCTGAGADQKSHAIWKTTGGELNIGYQDDKPIAGSTTQVSINAAANATDLRIIGADAASSYASVRLDVGSHNWKWYHYQNDNSMNLNYDSGTVRMHITTSGNVLINTTTVTNNEGLGVKGLGNDIQRWYDSSGNPYLWVDSVCDIIYNGRDMSIKANTSDTADNRATHFCGGGSNSDTRGAFVSCYGNEHASGPGDLYLYAGATGDIFIKTTNGLYINGVQGATYSGSVTSVQVIDGLITSIS